jgi:hypothetical protein
LACQTPVMLFVESGVVCASVAAPAALPWSQVSLVGAATLQASRFGRGGSLGGETATEGGGCWVRAGGGVLLAGVDIGATSVTLVAAVGLVSEAVSAPRRLAERCDSILRRADNRAARRGLTGEGGATRCPAGTITALPCQEAEEIRR